MLTCPSRRLSLFYSEQRQGYAGTLQISWSISGICRYPTGILTSVRCIRTWSTGVPWLRWWNAKWYPNQESNQRPLIITQCNIHSQPLTEPNPQPFPCLAAVCKLKFTTSADFRVALSEKLIHLILVAKDVTSWHSHTFSMTTMCSSPKCLLLDD